MNTIGVGEKKIDSPMHHDSLFNESELVFLFLAK